MELAQVDLRLETGQEGRMNLRLEMRHRSGILCELEADENGFFNVFIAEGQRLPPEWIVRGALDHYKAFLQTDWIIKERLAGRSIIHDCEGRVFSLPIPPTEEGEQGKGNGP